MNFIAGEYGSSRVLPSPHELLAECDRLGVVLSLDGDRLTVDAPRHVLASPFVDDLRGSKAEVVALLKARYPGDVPEADGSILGDADMRAFLASLGGDLAERWDERAAIAEFDGGLTRAEADRVALAGLLTSPRSLPHDPDAPPIEVPDPAGGWRADVARLPMPAWLRWRSLAEELAGPGATLDALDSAEREAYDQIIDPGEEPR